MALREPDQNWKDVYFTSQDGLRLHARHYPAEESSRRPVICLPGLTRNARDFHLLASFLADPLKHRRDVYCVDYRGRGASQYDPDWRNYTPFTETLDVLELMTIAGLHDAAIIGTSRGGLIAMIMAVLRPTTVGAVVFNDIGPVLEREGLTRIVGYVGRVPIPANWDEAAALVRDMNRRYFPAIEDEEWLEIARQWFNDENGQPNEAYDKNLSHSLSILDVEKGLPEMWAQFMALARVPMLVLRGEHSDILSEGTVREMAARHPDFRLMTIKGQGHAPFLRDADSISFIANFLAKTDSGVASPGEISAAA